MAGSGYATFGTFGAASGILGGDYHDAGFVSPGQPRAVRLAVQLRR